MNKLQVTTISLAAAAVCACNTTPTSNPTLDQARQDYLSAQQTPSTRDFAGTELEQAGAVLAQADAARSRAAPAREVDHLAYMAGQRVAIAEAVGARKAAESTVSLAEATRDKQRLAARTGQVESAQRQADVSQQRAVAAGNRADAASRQADSSQRAAADAQSRSAQLEAQVKELNAKQTERGLVMTVGDVLFDTNQARLKDNGSSDLAKLGSFMKVHPLRKVMVEGFTDNVGNSGSNQMLSARRAEAVRLALVQMGVGQERIATRGYGESFPVADNASANGRQMNRRVEIVVSNDDGAISPR